MCPKVSDALFLLISRLDVIFRLGKPIEASTSELDSEPLFYGLPVFFGAMPGPIIGKARVFRGESIIFL